MHLTATEPLSATWAIDRRAALAEAARSAARISLAGAIVLSPFRARIVLDERPLPPVFGDYTDLLLFWSELLVLALLLFWAISLLLQPRKVDLGPLLIRFPVLGVLAALCLSVPFAVEPELSLFNLVTVLGFVALGVYVLNEVERLSQLLPAIALLIVVQAVVAISQVVGQESFGLQSLGEFSLDPQNSGVSVVWTEDSPRLLRAYGLSDHPNILGGVLAFSVLLVGACITLYRGAFSTLLSLVFGLGVAAIFVTFSRSAALSLAAGLAVAFALFAARRDWSSLRLWIVPCLAAVLIVAPLIKPYSPYLIARLNPAAQAAGSTEERSLSEREALVKNTNEIFVAHPLAGVGAGGLPTAMFEAYPDFRYHHSPAHVVILVVAAETGLFGAFSYGLLTVGPWVLLWFHRNRITPELIGVSGALLAVTIVGLFDYYTWSLNAGRLWFWLVLGLWVMAYRHSLGRPADA